MPLYDAFISYSHAKDKPIASPLQSAIQRLGKPWYRRRARAGTNTASPIIRRPSTKERPLDK
jgi:hypothetical protein